MKKSKIFTTAKDNQAQVSVKVVQGERKIAKDNKELGVFELTGIPPAPSGIPQIEVTFDVDSNGILTVSALDKATLKEQTVTITSTSTLAPEDVLEKVAEAQAAAQEDARQQVVVRVRNDAESIAYTLERVMRDQRSRLQTSKVELVESKILLLRDELTKDELDMDLLQAVTEDLQEELKSILGEKVRETYDAEQGFTVPEEAEQKRATL